MAASLPEPCQSRPTRQGMPPASAMAIMLLRFLRLRFVSAAATWGAATTSTIGLRRWKKILQAALWPSS
eukprot:scaffold29401_cov38-Prasinocladus_malaysianus.AAC.1